MPQRYVKDWTRFALAAGAVLLTVCRPAAVGGQSVGAADASARQFCVLLRNGNVLLGSVQESEDGFIVTRQGATVHVPHYQVRAVCEDLVTAYERQRAAISPADPVSHLQLAEWCIEQELFQEARQELETAVRRVPTHPRLAVLQRRLAVAHETHAVVPAKPREDHPLPATRAPTGSNSGRAAGLAPHFLTPVTPEDLEPTGTAVTELPDESMEQFRRRIQPLLLNSCTTSGCHQSGEHGGFVLDRGALRGSTTPTLTSENLAAALVHVDIHEPLQSPLLRAATQAHTARMEAPPILPDSKSYALLEEWLLHISGRDATDPNASEPQAAEPAGSADGSVDPADVTISAEELDALFYGKEIPTIIDRRVQRGVRPVPVRRGDPFDPKEFNDRYFPQQGGPKEGP